LIKFPNENAEKSAFTFQFHRRLFPKVELEEDTKIKNSYRYLNHQIRVGVINLERFIEMYWV